MQSVNITVYPDVQIGDLLQTRIEEWRPSSDLQRKFTTETEPLGNCFVSSVVEDVFGFTGRVIVRM